LGGSLGSVTTDAAHPAPPGSGEPATPEQIVLDGELEARLAAIENLPLDQRAESYATLHASLRDHLEGGDVPRSKAE